MINNVEVILVSNTALQGVIEYRDTRYFIELSWLDHIEDNRYHINETYLTLRRVIDPVYVEVSVGDQIQDDFGTWYHYVRRHGVEAYIPTELLTQRANSNNVYVLYRYAVEYGLITAGEQI